MRYLECNHIKWISLCISIDMNIISNLNTRRLKKNNFDQNILKLNSFSEQIQTFKRARCHFQYKWRNWCLIRSLCGF